MSKKKLLIITLLIGLPSLALFYWHFSASQKALSESEKASAYENILGRDIKEERKIETKNYQGKYFSFKYPSFLSIKEATTSPELKSETIRMIGFEPRLNLTVLASDANSTNLADYSGVKFRKQNSEEYKQLETKLNETDALIFDKTGSETEKTVFFKKDGTMFSMSVTGSNKIEAEKLFAQVLESLTF